LSLEWFIPVGGQHAAQPGFDVTDARRRHLEFPGQVDAPTLAERLGQEAEGPTNLPAGPLAPKNFCVIEVAAGVLVRAIGPRVGQGVRQAYT
jgi:hypothetical protein